MDSSSSWYGFPLLMSRPCRQNDLVFLSEKCSTRPLSPLLLLRSSVLGRYFMHRISILFIVLLILNGCFSDYIEHEFSSYSEAVEAGFGGIGLAFPPYFKSTMRDIVVVDNVDLNQIFLTFRFSNTKSTQVEEHCSSADYARAVYPKARVVSNIDWWPKELAQGKQVPKKSMDYYTCKRMKDSLSALLVIDINESKAFYWEDFSK